MKRLIATLFVVSFVLTPFLSAQAGSPLADLERKLSTFIAQAGESAQLMDAPVARAVQATHGAVIAYFTVVSGQWWTGLAITNNSSNANYITVGCFDMNGNAVGAGTLTLAANAAIQSAMIADFVKTGTVPQRGSIAVFGTESFFVDRFLGDSVKGGIGEVQLEAQPL